MARSGAVTFKGNPLTLAGEAVKVGQQAPDFTLHYFEAGSMKTIKPADLKGKPTIFSVVPSLDTPVVPDADQEVQRAARVLGRQDQRGDGEPGSAVRHEPLLRRREHQEHAAAPATTRTARFGKNWGMLIDELKILARGMFVLDKDGKVVHAEQVKEVTEEPNYDAAIRALKGVTS